MQGVWVAAQDEFMWFLMRKNGIGENAQTRTRCWCAYCGAHGELEIDTCNVTMQCDDEDKSCMKDQAEYPEAFIMANSLREEDVCSHKVGVHRGDTRSMEIME